MESGCRLWVFNAKVIAYFGIALPLYSHNWLIALVLSLGTHWETAFGGVPLSPSVILVCREQDCLRQRLLAIRTFFIRSRTFLPPQHGPWAWYEMSQVYQILWLHNCPLKPCCLVPRTKRRVLMSSGSCRGLSSPVLDECQGLFARPRHAPGVSVYGASPH